MHCVLVNHNPIVQLFKRVFDAIPAFGDLSNYFGQLVGPEDTNPVKKYLYLLGAASLTIQIVRAASKLSRMIGWVVPHSINRSRLTPGAMKNKYGSCWVGITGFTEGIGFAYAELFAQMGFNLLLISRNQQKVNRKANLIRSHYPNILIKTIVADLSSEASLTELMNKIEEVSQQIELGIFINNAGFTAGGQFLNIEPKDLVATAHVNLTSMIKLSQTIIPILRRRLNSRSALVNLSSCTGIFISPLVGFYSAGKVAIDRFTRFAAAAHSDRIDVISVTPFGVTTNMMKQSKGPMIITPSDCAFSSIADLLAGKKSTFSGAKHKLSAGVMGGNTEQQNLQLYADIWSKKSNV